MISVFQILNWIKKLIRNSYFNFFFPFILMGLGYLIVKDQKSLSYHFSSPSIIQIFDTLNCNENKVQSIELSIYNDGNTIIDNIDFLNEDGITIKNTEKVKVLSASLIKKNRDDFNLYSKIDSLDSTSFNIELAKNEVLEINDVITYRIIFSASKQGEWLIKSRIKGLPDGIIKGDIHPNEYKVVRSISIIWFCLILIFLFRYILFLIYKKKFGIRKIELGFISAYLFFSIILYYEYYHDVKILESIISK